MITIPERQWEKPPRPDHPAPEVACRPAVTEEVPRGARTLRDFAERHNWAVATTYARGTRPGPRPRVVDSVALRMSRGGARAWAVWIDGKFDAGQILYPGGTPLPVNVSALRGQLSLQREEAR